jgi:hypothetical protein
MGSDNHRRGQDERRDERHGGILRRIEEKLDHLLGSGDDDWHEREWAPPGDPRPRFFEEPPAEAWDSSFAAPRFDRVDVGSVGSDAVHPASLDPEQGPFIGARSSAREYYLAMRARQQKAAGDGANRYADYRRRKRAELDSEYAEYCHDRQACFDRDFEDWRQKRAGRAPSVDEPARQESAAEDEARGH